MIPPFRELFSFTAAIMVSAIMAANAAPITTNTALPVNEGEFILRAQVKYISSTDDPSPAERELTVWSAPSVLVYGLAEKFSLFGIVPYLDKSLEMNTPSGRQMRGDSGLGDIRVFGRYTLGQWDHPGETLRVAWFAGLELPTGTDDVVDSLGRLPQPLQLGSGSWDPFVGAVFTWQTLQWEFDSSIAYNFNTEANGFEFGDVVRFDLSYQYRLWPNELGDAVPSYLYGVVESNLIWKDNNRAFGDRDSNSGGTAWYLAPGIQYVTKRYIIEGAVQFPIIQDLNGNALKNDLIVTTGFRVNF
ncbi:MAG: transporter [Opitutaceae bacterium]|nr:transporter [Opitutaceae bacterium]